MLQYTLQSFFSPLPSPFLLIPFLPLNLPLILYTIYYQYTAFLLSLDLSALILECEYFPSKHLPEWKDMYLLIMGFL